MCIYIHVAGKRYKRKAKYSSTTGKGKNATCENKQDNALLHTMYILRVNVNVYIFSSCGGMGQEASGVLVKLADALATKRNENYNHAIGCLRLCLPFTLAKSAVRCILGSRSIPCGPHHQAPVDLVWQT